MAEIGSGQSTTLICQVLNAKPDHKIDETNNLLRSKHFPSSKKVIYLGNVATTLISLLQHPETPEFKNKPNYNEQKWEIVTRDGQLKITIVSDSYWGFGLFNSSYLNTIILDGPLNLRSRVIFDLVSSLPHKPWEFKHLSAIRRWMNKNHPKLDEKINQNNWNELVNFSKQKFEEIIEIMSEAISKISQKVKNTNSSDDWDKEKSAVLVAAAEFDLQLAKGALADDNGPAIERAIARIEASLIEADPETGIHKKINEDEVFEQKIIISDITMDNEESVVSNLETINEIDSIVSEEDIPLVDLTGISEQE
ncbi:MAG: hypothetical protein CMA92_02020 [Euryarchaeota archaeon]|nr:hypothetical protein [Euryarchaeota archaeon]|tara:strand:+ start:384 stop:1310 length:927 start_codon:yes stop_codon:yes gene_type:complete